MPKRKTATESVSASDKKIESVPVSSEITASTDIPRFREETRATLARYIVIGLFSLLILIAMLLFILALLGKSEASIFKDILLSFIGFASGILVTILGFYYKGKKDNGE